MSTNQVPEMPVRRGPLLRRALALCLACGAPALLAAVACVVAPPADPPPAQDRRPKILRDGVVPPVDRVLERIPAAGFSVPVELGGPNQAFYSAVFIDYDPVLHSAPLIYPTPYVPLGAPDGGVVVIHFALDETIPELDPAFCHRIEFLVAHAFNQTPV